MEGRAEHLGDSATRNQPGDDSYHEHQEGSDR
jgi:hypothetical protein